MLELEPVSKYIKQQHSRKIRQQTKIHKSISIETHRGVDLSYFEQFDPVRLRLPYNQRQFQDSHLTHYLHEQLLNLQLTLRLVAIISVITSLSQSVSPYSPQAKTTVLAFYSVFSIFLVILLILRHNKNLELSQKQLVRIPQQNKILLCVRQVGLQAIFMLIHPNLVCKDVILMIPQPISGQRIPTDLNSILEILMLGRIYVFLSTIVYSSIYHTPRSQRLCRIYNTKSPLIFSFKSFFHAYPLLSLILLFGTLAVTFGQMLKLAQSKVGDIQTLQQGLWCIVITMSTVGYGDYYPKTYVGRMVAFFAAISGIIMASLLILTLSRYLAMNSREAKSHVTLKRLQLRKVLQEYAQRTLLATTKLGSAMGSSSQVERGVERTKLAMRRLKNLVQGQGQNNMKEQIQGLFETLNANLLEIYLKQMEYAQGLKQLYQTQGKLIRQIGFSFAGEIEKIIRQ